MDVKKLWFWFCCCVPLALQAQDFPLEAQNPPRLAWTRWRLKEQPFDLIFPRGADSLAQQAIRYLSAYQQLRPMSLGKRRWPIVLQNQSNVSNGFVTLFPKRMELFARAPQRADLSGTNDWIPFLIAHEMRHVHQNEQVRRALPKLFHALGGVYATAMFNEVLFPSWLTEGDAIQEESRLNPMGRKDIPEFNRPLLAYLMQIGLPHYAKQNGGSYLDLVPNHYVFGQYLSGTLERSLGEQAGPRLYDLAPKRWYWPFLSRTISRELGQRQSMDRYAMNQLKALLQEGQQAHAAFGPNPDSLLVAAPKKAWVSYEKVQWGMDGAYVGIKSSFQQVDLLVEGKAGQERILRRLGPQVEDGLISSLGDWVVWSEGLPDLRFAQRQQQRIMAYHRPSAQVKEWRRGPGLMSPSLGNQGQWLAYLSFQENGSSSLVVSSLDSNNVVFQWDIPPGVQCLHPRLDAQQSLVWVQIQSGKKSLVVLDLKLGKKQEIPMQDWNLAQPFKYGEWVLFQAPWQGIDQIFAYDLNRQQCFQVTADFFGAYSPSLSEQGLLYVSHSARGREIRLGKWDPKQWRPMALPAPAHVPNALNKAYLNANIPAYSSKPYGLGQFLNIYAWGPTIASNGQQLDLAFQSRNLLSTTFLEWGTRFQTAEQTWSPYLRLSYQALFPIIDLEYQNSPRRTQLYVDNRPPLDSLRTDEWRQQTWSLGLRLPFNFSRGANLSRLQLGAKWHGFQVDGYDLRRRFRTEAFNGTYQYWSLGMDFYWLRRMAYYDVQFPLGFQVSLKNLQTPAGSSLQAGLVSLQSRVFLPGILPHHGLALRYGFQQQITGNYNFAGQVFYPRTFAYRLFNQLQSFQAEYRFPLANVDWRLGRLLYIKRWKAGLIYEAAQGKNTSKELGSNQNFENFGAELSAQIHVYRSSYPLELGLRTLYQPQQKSWFWYPLVLDIGF